MDLMLCIWRGHIVSVLLLRGHWPRLYARTCDDLWGNLTLKRMQMREWINIQRRSFIDLSRCKAISIDSINIQQRRAGTQNNTVSKTATRRWKQKENKGGGGGTIIAIWLPLTNGLMVTLFLHGQAFNQ